MNQSRGALPAREVDGTGARRDYHGGRAGCETDQADRLRVALPLPAMRPQVDQPRPEASRSLREMPAPELDSPRPTVHQAQLTRSHSTAPQLFPCAELLCDGTMA